MSNPLIQKRWSPYLVGIGIGVLSWFAFATANHPLGITTAYEYTAALGAQAVAPQIEESNPYYADLAAQGKSPKINWEWMVVVGVFLGALLSSWLSKDRTNFKVPKLWAWQFGVSVGKRFLFAVLGAALMMFGARMAQGCTSGHGISGTLQLAVSSWVFILAAFGCGVITAFLMYGKEGRNNV